jgi:hypothetical protein
MRNNDFKILLEDLDDSRLFSFVTLSLLSISLNVTRFCLTLSSLTECYYFRGEEVINTL